VRSILADSVNDFLDHFEHPTRALIYANLLEFASFSNDFVGDNTAKRFDYLQSILTHAPEWSLSQEDVDKALTDTATAFPYLVEGAKGPFVVLVHLLLTDNRTCGLTQSIQLPQKAFDRYFIVLSRRIWTGMTSSTCFTFQHPILP
jgi:hypothetical protein